MKGVTKQPPTLSEALRDYRKARKAELGAERDLAALMDASRRPGDGYNPSEQASDAWKAAVIETAEAAVALARAAQRTITETVQYRRETDAKILRLTMSCSAAMLEVSKLKSAHKIVDDVMGYRCTACGEWNPPIEGPCRANPLTNPTEGAS